MKNVIYGAAASIGIAGILHLMLVPTVINFNLNTTIFFIIVGILQLVWILPIIKHKGVIWYLIGIAGNAILIILWTMTRFENTITGRTCR